MCRNRFAPTVILLVGGLFGLVVQQTDGRSIVETFDIDLGNFDTAVNNRANGNDWGWLNTNNTGGVAGELGGGEKRTGDDCVCDAKLGGSLTENDAIIMRGKGWLRDENADGILFIGYREPGVAG